MKTIEEIKEMVSDLQSQIRQCDNLNDKIKGKYFIQALEWVLEE